MGFWKRLQLWSAEAGAKRYEEKARVEAAKAGKTFRRSKPHTRAAMKAERYAQMSRERAERLRAELAAEQEQQPRQAKGDGQWPPPASPPDDPNVKSTFRG